MKTYSVAPLFLLCAGILLLAVWRLKTRRKKDYPKIIIDAASRMEALNLIARLSAARERALELDGALTKRGEGVRWQFGIDGNAFRDADSDIDAFLSERTQRQLEVTEGEIISLFRDAAKWLEKYAPRKTRGERIADALETILRKLFSCLKRMTGLNFIPVVEKAWKKQEDDLPEEGEEDDFQDIFPAESETPEKFRLPLDLLEAGKSENVRDAASLRETARRIAEAFTEHGVDVIAARTPVAGPSVTRYEFRPGKGVKLSKIMNLADDIALSLGSAGVRIAPVTGKGGVVGIEVPNRRKTPVLLRDVIEARDFAYAPATVFALGKGVDGQSVTADLEALPHVLIAGTTGSGKSVCLNALIISLLYKSAPEELRFLMIDPKRVELTPYDGIPHLTQPVVTDPADAAPALEEAVREMENRYALFEKRGVKTLTEYNKGKEPLPRLVIVIDELADLMMVSGKEIEASVVRIAQMGRAAGMHLVIATQRPSSDVITGLMKANIPSRIAFTVASAMESRIILDDNGAEKLTGNGDMLYKPNGGQAQRLQGAYVSPEEIEKVVAALKKS